MTAGPETCYRVRGGASLQGTVFVQGAKNAALKMIAASLLAAEGRTVLRNVPPIEDVHRAVELAQALGLQGISESQVSLVFQDLDAEVERFRTIATSARSARRRGSKSAGK